MQTYAVRTVQDWSHGTGVSARHVPFTFLLASSRLTVFVPLRAKSSLPLVPRLILSDVIDKADFHLFQLPTSEGMEGAPDMVWATRRSETDDIDDNPGHGERRGDCTEPLPKRGLIFCSVANSFPPHVP